jgi:acyl carrier protein
MESDKFYVALAEILETERVKDEDILRQFDVWDSLTKLSIIAMAGSDYKTTLNAKDLDTIETVGDLRIYLEKHGR